MRSHSSSILRSVLDSVFVGAILFVFMLWADLRTSYRPRDPYSVVEYVTKSTDRDAYLLGCLLVAALLAALPVFIIGYVCRCSSMARPERSIGLLVATLATAVLFAFVFFDCNLYVHYEDRRVLKSEYGWPFGLAISLVGGLAITSARLVIGSLAKLFLKILAGPRPKPQS